MAQISTRCRTATPLQQRGTSPAVSHRRRVSPSWGRTLRVAAALVLTAACGSTVQHRAVGADRAGGDLSLTPGAGSAPTTAGTPGTVGTPGTAGTAGTVGTAGAIGGTSSGGSTPAGSTGAAAVGTGGPGSPAVSIPARGQGWDEKFVYIGIMTMKDGEKAVAGSPVSVGDQEGDAQAIVAALNREGGLFGRQIKLIVHDNALARAQSDPSTVGQENCTAFTQDRPVLAVLALPAPADKEALRACLAKARTLQVSIGNAVWDDEVGRRYAPYFYHAGFPSVSRLVPVLVSRLKEQKYFTGWDTNAGGPSAAAPVKVGVLYGNDETGRRQANAFAAAFKKAGHATVTFEYAGPNDFAAAVLRFRQNGVTHVTGPVGDLGMMHFLLAAKAQRYYPRLGIHSYMVPRLTFQEFAGATREQLNGAVGVGWYEGADVRTAQDPGDSPGAKWCLKALATGGQTFEKSDRDRFAQAVGFAICDGIRFPVQAAQAGGGLDPGAIRKGILSIARDYALAAAGFGISGITKTNFGLPGAARDLRYNNRCDCFTYTGGTYAL